MRNVALMILMLLLNCVSSHSYSVSSKVNTSEQMDEGLLDYKGVLEAQKNDQIFIIDVRELSEIEETGKLPGSIHIPMKDVLKELSLSSEAFEKKYGKKKPSLDTEIITSCRSGKRSKMVQLKLQKEGYKNVFSYSGGWLDWEKQQMN